jgi:choline dehydrogenase-like flavoprotein
MSLDRFDVIIIGTGAGGGTLLHELASTGKRILVLERGGFLPRERENWDARAVNAESRYQSRETWYDADDRPFSPYTHYWVGGNTKVYGAALLRMREHDFGEVRHYGGVSPAWPLSYADFEPFYTRAERLYSVHGERGLDPHDPPTSAPYPHGPLAHEARMKEVFDDLTALGHRPFPVPIGLRLPERVGGAVRGPETRLSMFDGYPDPTETKADSHVSCVQPALERSNVTLLTNTMVERLVTTSSGREVTGVVAVHRGERVMFQASIVVLACGAINSAALLLRSSSDVHRNGLANASGMVGRNYMCHHNGLFIVVTDTPNPSVFQKSFAMTDFYRGADDSEFALGTIQLMGKPDRWTVESLAKGALPGVSVDDILPRTIDFFLTAEDLPQEENRVTLRSDGAIKLSRRENNLGAYTRLKEKLSRVMDRCSREGRLGANPVYLETRLGISGVSHQCGTLRFGTNPATSVLDVDCRAHGVENLYVADSSFFPSSAAVNPSLTIMANAIRVGGIIAARL